MIVIHPDICVVPKALLFETLRVLSPKPWDDHSLLHARLSAMLGQEISYVDHIRDGWDRYCLYLDEPTQTWFKPFVFGKD